MNPFTTPTWMGRTPVPLTPRSQQMLGQGMTLPKRSAGGGGSVTSGFNFGPGPMRMPMVGATTAPAGGGTMPAPMMPMRGGGGGGGFSGMTSGRTSQPDGKIHGFSYKEKGLDGPMGSVGGLYAMNQTDNPAFYNTGDTNSVPQLLGKQGPGGGLKFGFAGNGSNVSAPMPAPTAAPTGAGLDPNAWSTFDPNSGAWKPDAVPKRATGGPVAPGQPYIVGERGPEMIVPQQAGTVLPNEMMTSLPDMRALRTPYGSGVAVDNGAPVPLPMLNKAATAIEQAPGAMVSNPGAEAAMARALPMMPLPASTTTPRSALPVLTTKLDEAAAMVPPGVRARDWQRFTQTPQGISTLINMQGDQQRINATAKLWEGRDQRDMDARKMELQARQQEKANDLNAQEMGYRVQAEDFLKQGHLTPEHLSILDHTKDPATRVAILKSLTSMGETTAKTAAEKAKQEASRVTGASGVPVLTPDGRPTGHFLPITNTGKMAGGAMPLPQAPAPTLTAEDIAAANAMGADVTTKVGNATFTSKAKVPDNRRMDELHSTQTVQIEDPITKQKRPMVVRHFRNGQMDMVDPSMMKATDGQIKPMKPASTTESKTTSESTSAAATSNSLASKTASLIQSLKKQ